MSRRRSKVEPPIDPGTEKVLDCGCRIYRSTAEEAFVMQPCSPTCVVYRTAMEMAREQGKPVEYRTTGER